MPITESTLNFIPEFLRDIAGRVLPQLMSEHFWIQFAAVALAVFIAAGVSAFVGKKHAYWRSKNRISEKFNRPLDFFFGICSGVAFSLAAALVLSLCVNILQKTGMLAAGGEPVFARVAYSVFYAWALIIIILQVLRVMIGPKFENGAIEKGVKIVFWVLAVLQIAGILGNVVDAMHEVAIPIGSGSLSLWSAMVGVLTVALALVVANWIAGLIERRIMVNGNIEVNLRVVISRVCRVGLLTLAVLISLSFAGVDLTILSVFGGAIGVGLGFGLQKIASNYVSGFIILLDRSVRIGDLVEVGAFQGVVTKINTRYSVVRNLSGEELVVPNEMFVTSSVKNFSGSDRAATGSVEVGIAYEANVDRALEILLDIMKSQPRVMQTPAPRVVISGFGDSEIMLKGVFWVRDPEAGVGSLKSAIFREVLRRFDAENIEIPYAKSEVKLSGAVALTPAANVESQPAVKPAEVKAGQAVK